MDVCWGNTFNSRTANPIPSKIFVVIRVRRAVVGKGAGRGSELFSRKDCLRDVERKGSSVASLESHQRINQKLMLEGRGFLRDKILLDQQRDVVVVFWA